MNKCETTSIKTAQNNENVKSSGIIMYNKKV